MSRRSQLEHEVSVAQERVKKAAKDTPKDIIKLWEQELVDLELELNNLVDDEEDNNDADDGSNGHHGERTEICLDRHGVHPEKCACL